MKKHYASFTSILFALHEGRLTIDELSSPNAILAFGTTKDYLLGHEVPNEVNYLKKKDKEPLELWNNLKEIIRQADQQGRCLYKTGNHTSYCIERIKEGMPVWWQAWRTADDWPLETETQ